MSLGERIKSLRKGESQAVFGARFGASRNTIMRYESGERTPDADFLAALCNHYGINPTWLLLGEGEMSREEAVEPQTKTCDDPRCVGPLRADGHLLSRTPTFDAELLSHIFNELHAYKASFPGRLSEQQELDVISLASVFLQPENKEEAALICSIVNKWLNGKNQPGKYTGTLRNFGTVMGVDLVSDKEIGFIEVDYGSGEILQLFRIAFEQLPNKTPAIKKAKETVFGSIIGCSNIEITGIPVLNKKVLRESRRYKVPEGE